MTDPQRDGTTSLLRLVLGRIWQPCSIIHLAVALRELGITEKVDDCVDIRALPGHVTVNGIPGGVMVDLLESKLISAGKMPLDDSRIVTALNAVVADRADQAKAPSRRRIVPAISIGLSLALLGTGAAAASQWGPWVNVPEPDLAFSREWTDVHGNVLGTCETRIATTSLSGEQRAAAQQFLANLDVGALKPDPEYVASGLVAVGRGEEIGDLVDGARITDYSITHTGKLWPDHGNAAILQHALMMRVFNSMSANVIARWPDLANTLQSTSETQCTPNSNAVVIP